MAYAMWPYFLPSNIAWPIRPWGVQPGIWRIRKRHEKCTDCLIWSRVTENGVNHLLSTDVFCIVPSLQGLGNISYDSRVPIVIGTWWIMPTYWKECPPCQKYIPKPMWANSVLSEFKLCGCFSRCDWEYCRAEDDHVEQKVQNVIEKLPGSKKSHKDT